MDIWLACQDNINAPRVIELLEAGADINATISPTNTETALIVAIRAGAMDIVTLLVERGADINTGGSINRLPLHYAIAFHMTDIITYLLNHHADVTLTNHIKYTALHCAVVSGATETITRILAAGAVVDAKDDQGRTPLYHLFSKYFTNWRENSLQLLANGADINTQDVEGDTILHHTTLLVIIDNVDKVRFLLDHGASVEIKNGKGLTPVNNAVILNAFNSGSVRYNTILTLLQDHILMGTLKNAGRRK